MRIFSGIRPTGDLHIGNYVGAVKQWIDLQEKNECIFCIVDLHAITTPYEPKELHQKVLSQAAAYIALGLDPEKCILFVQSHVREHTELAWLLGTVTPVGDLQRMTQYKDKSSMHNKYINAGLLNYPVLMAADILLYGAETVPVGEDQKQHVEMARTIARKFNGQFGESLKIPKAALPKSGAKIKSLQNPERKMSKTESDQGCIGLFEEPEKIRKKIMSAVTDNEKKIKYDEKKKPGISNLLTIHSAFTGLPIKEIEKNMSEKSYAEFKKEVADNLIKKLEPIKRKKDDLDSRETYVQEILKSGASRASTIAQTTMIDVRKKMGFLK